MSSRTRSNGDATEPDELVPDPKVCREFSVSAMTLWRWTQDQKLGFPPRIKIRKRNFRSRKALDAFKHKLMRNALVQPRDRIVEA